jgi:hypothetical protein
VLGRAHSDRSPPLNSPRPSRPLPGALPPTNGDASRGATFPPPADDDSAACQTPSEQAPALPEAFLTADGAAAMDSVFIDAPTGVKNSGVMSSADVDWYKAAILKPGARLHPCSGLGRRRRFGDAPVLGSTGGGLPIPSPSTSTAFCNTHTTYPAPHQPRARRCHRHAELLPRLPADPHARQPAGRRRSVEVSARARLRLLSFGGVQLRARRGRGTAATCYVCSPYAWPTQPASTLAPPPGRCGRSWTSQHWCCTATATSRWACRC